MTQKPYTPYTVVYVEYEPAEQYRQFMLALSQGRVPVGEVPRAALRCRVVDGVDALAVALDELRKAMPTVTPLVFAGRSQQVELELVHRPEVVFLSAG